MTTVVNLSGDACPTENHPHPVDVAVQFVAAQQGGAARLLTEHRPHGNARTCLGCGARWPCSLSLIARRAALLAP